MAIKALVFVFTSIFVIASCASQKAIKEPREEILFKNFVLANCLGRAFKETAVAVDANKAANGYMEFGSLPFEAYEASNRLIDAWLNRSYESKSGGQIATMKCLDLYRSAELKALYDEHTPCSKRGGGLDEEHYRNHCQE